MSIISTMYHNAEPTSSNDQLADPLNQGIRDRLNGVQRDESNPDTCSAETLKRFGDRFDADKQANAAAIAAADAFIARHPEITDSDANAKQLVATAQAAFNTKYPTEEMYERVLPNVVAKGLIELDEKELKRQANAKAKAATKAQESLTEEEQYSFSLDDLRLVSDGLISPGEARRRHIEARRANGIA